MPKGKGKRPIPRGGSHKPGITEEIIDRFVEWIEAGMSNEEAAAAAGIAESTYYVWRRKGLKDPATLYGQLNRKVSEALARDKERSVKVVRDSEDWKAHAWWLERRHQMSNRQVLAGDPNAPLKLSIIELVQKEAEKNARKLEESSEDGDGEA